MAVIEGLSKESLLRGGSDGGFLWALIEMRTVFDEYIADMQSGGVVVPD